MLAYFLVAAALLGSPTDRLQDPALEAQAKTLETELIAPCCWRAPVSDHYSEAANQIRVEIRRMLAEGKTHDEILRSFVDIHGKQILSSPPASGFDLISWVLPFVALGFGAAVVVWFTKTHSRTTAPATRTAKPIDKKYAEMIAKEMRE